MRFLTPIFLASALAITTPAFAVDDTLSLDGATPTLVQDFKTAPTFRKNMTDYQEPVKPLSDPGFNWASGYIWNHAPAGQQVPPKGQPFPAFTSNGNANADPNGDMQEKLGANRTLSWAGTLNFTLRKTPDDIVPMIGDKEPKEFLGASIISYPYSQQYGVFAMKAKIPKGKGTWPAFWLLPVDKSWPPEIDIMEVIGEKGTTVFTTLHEKAPPAEKEATHGQFDAKVDLSAGFHEYAVDWGPQTITWYLDRKKIFSTPTTDQFRGQPFYILATLSMGRAQDWGGAPDANTKLPAVMQVEYIKAWQRPDYVTAGASAGK